MFYLFVIPELIGWIVEHWEIVVGLVAFGAAVAGVIFWIRAVDKQQIHKTHVENIDALKSLIDARDATIATRDATIIEEKAARAKAEADTASGAAALDTLRSEYKIVSGIVLSELIMFEARRIRHLAELADMSSTLQIKQQQIEMLQKRLAENC